MCMGVSPYVCLSTCVVCPRRSEEDVESSGHQVTDSCEPPCGCWGSNPDLWKSSLVLLTPEPSFQPSVLGPKVLKLPRYFSLSGVILLLFLIH